MHDDDLETIDLGEPTGSAWRAEPGPRAPRPRRIVVAVIALVFVAGAGIGIALHARHQSGPARAVAPDAADWVLSTDAPTSPSTTTWTAPPGLVGLLPGRFVAVVDGIPILVGDGPPRRILADVAAGAVVDASSGGAVLLSFRDPGAARIIVGPDFGSGIRTALPSPIQLLPDAEGRLWSNFGQLQVPGELQKVTVPPGTEPVARLAEGYLLVDAAHTRLLSWRPGLPLTPIGVGEIRVLAVAHDVVAFSDRAGSVVHIVNLATGRAIDVDTGSFAASARFSPDRTRLAILVRAEREYLMLADVVSGDLLADIATAPSGGGLHSFAEVPPALQPVPFSWAPRGALIVETHVDGDRRFLLSIEPRDGTVRDPVPAPAGLDQLVVLSG